jgi:hypothetical protein
MRARVNRFMVYVLRGLTFYTWTKVTCIWNRQKKFHVLRTKGNRLGVAADDSRPARVRQRPSGPSAAMFRVAGAPRQPAKPLVDPRPAFTLRPWKRTLSALDSPPPPWRAKAISYQSGQVLLPSGMIPKIAESLVRPRCPKMPSSFASSIR